MNVSPSYSPYQDTCSSFNVNSSSTLWTFSITTVGVVHSKPKLTKDKLFTNVARHCEIARNNNPLIVQ